MKIESQSESQSEKNAKELQERFDNSPFDDIKFFVAPNHKTSVENCTAQALRMMDEIEDFHAKIKSGEIEAEYTFSSED